MLGWIKRLFGAQEKQKSTPTKDIAIKKDGKNDQSVINASGNSSVTIGNLKSRGYSTVIRADRNTTVRVNSIDFGVDSDPVEVSRPTPSHSARTSSHSSCSSGHTNIAVANSYHHQHESHTCHSDSGSWGSDSGSSDSSCGGGD